MEFLRNVLLPFNFNRYYINMELKTYAITYKNILNSAYNKLRQIVYIQTLHHFYNIKYDPEVILNVYNII